MKLLAAALALLLPAAALAQQGQVKVENAWARATPQGAEIAAVYMTLIAPKPDRLVSVSSPAAMKAEVHEMSMEGGVMRMRETPAVTLPADQPVVFRPGGYHVMLMGLARPLRQGQTVALHLTFANSAPADVTAQVEGIGASGPAKP